MFKLFEVKEGKLKVLPTLSPKYVKGFIISSVILLLISGLSGWLKMDEKQLWKIYNAIIQHFGLTHEIPKPKDVEKEIESRVELEVDKAIRDYELLTGDTSTVKIPSPKYIEKPIDNSLCYTEECKKLGGEIRLCAPWILDCVDTSESVTKGLTKDH
jgi:hypothetical protein